VLTTFVDFDVPEGIHVFPSAENSLFEV